jgi:hypothetical protein
MEIKGRRHVVEKHLTYLLRNMGLSMSRNIGQRLYEL